MLTRADGGCNSTSRPFAAVHVGFNPHPSVTTGVTHLKLITPSVPGPFGGVTRHRTGHCYRRRHHLEL